MHILLSILGALGMVIIVLWRVQQAAYIARDVADAAGTARGLFRRWRWRRKVNVNPIDLVEDPREAASILMVSVAQADGTLSDAERNSITAQMKQRFGATSKQASELLARSQWIVREGVDAAETMRRLKPVFDRTCNDQQHRELIEMLTAVASANGKYDETIAFDINRYGKELGA